MRRVVFSVIGIGLVAGALGAVLVRVPAVQDFVMRRVIARRISCTAEAAEKTGRTRIAKILGDIPSYHSSPLHTDLRRNTLV